MSPGTGSAELNLSDAYHNPITLLDLASNDYLGLSRHPNLIKAVSRNMQTEGVGAGASRLITGSRPIHQKLEEGLSTWLGQESVLLFPSGFQANLAAVLALANRSTTVITDKLIHHSLLVGVKASGSKLKRFAHNDILELEKYLQQYATQKPLVITESLFSMEGTSPPLIKIVELCNRYKAKLIVDEAHAIGIMGKSGKGLCHEISDQITIISGTFGKAFGSGGAFLASSSAIREHLIQTSGAFRYTTALAPPLAAASLEALNLIKSNPQWGEGLLKEAHRWRQNLMEAGWTCPPGNGPIIPLIIGSDQEALKFQNQLENHGLLSMAIRPPTVPEGTARLRVVIRKGLPENTLERVLTCLGER